MIATIEGCFIYPVKACAGLAVDELLFGAHGELRGDREWVVVDAAGIVTWLGALPRLALLKPTVVRGRLGLVSPMGGFVPLPDAAACRPCEIACWDGASARHVTMPALDGGDALAGLASAVAGTPVRLARPLVDAHRVNPVHVASLPSVQEALGVSPGDEAWAATARFRANLVLGSAGEDLPPFIEDHARALVFDGQRLLVYAPCERCVCVDVDPATAATGPETLAAVARDSQRRVPGAPVQFGVYARSVGPGGVKRGTVGCLELDF